MQEVPLCRNGKLMTDWQYKMHMDSLALRTAQAQDGFELVEQQRRGAYYTEEKVLEIATLANRLGRQEERQEMALESQRAEWNRRKAHLRG